MGRIRGFVPGGAGSADASPALPSASVILVRPAAEGFEVFMVRRQATASAFADAYVFPGGTVRDDDYLDQSADAGFSPDDALAALTARGGTPPHDASQALALWRTALRELFEEAGVLLARDATGRSLQITDAAAPRFMEFRRTLQAGQSTLADVLTRERLKPDYRGLRYFSHWITPAHLPRRFDTRFFVAELPLGQTALHCQIETTEGVWIRPAEALRQADGGRFGIVFPTRRHLERLGQHDSVEALLDFAAVKPIRTVQAVLDARAGTERIVLPAGLAECW